MRNYCTSDFPKQIAVTEFRTFFVTGKKMSFSHKPFPSSWFPLKMNNIETTKRLFYGNRGERGTCKLASLEEMKYQLKDPLSTLRCCILDILYWSCLEGSYYHTPLAKVQYMLSNISIYFPHKEAKDSKTNQTNTQEYMNTAHTSCQAGS